VSEKGFVEAYWEEIIRRGLDKDIRWSIFGTFDFSSDSVHSRWSRGTIPGESPLETLEKNNQKLALRPEAGDILVDGEWLPNLVKYRTVEEDK
jgi:hypothetical protein